MTIKSFSKYIIGLLAALTISIGMPLAAHSAPTATPTEVVVPGGTNTQEIIVVMDNTSLATKNVSIEVVGAQWTTPQAVVTISTSSSTFTQCGSSNLGIKTATATTNYYCEVKNLTFTATSSAIAQISDSTTFGLTATNDFGATTTFKIPVGALRFDAAQPSGGYRITTVASGNSYNLVNIQLTSSSSPTPTPSPTTNATTSASLTLSATTGQLVAGSTVAIVASGLQATAGYEVVLRSTPQTLTTGNAVSGSVNTSVTLPAGLEAGWHSLTFTSTAADGSALESKVYFKVSSTGALLSTSQTLPAELANTGFEAAPYLITGAVLLLAGALTVLYSRRRATK